MSVASSSPELLKKAVLELIGECRHHLQEGVPVDVSQVERGVRVYCTTIAALPMEEARKYAEDMQKLTEEMTRFNEELKAARDVAYAELESLSKIRKASAAYQKSDAIGGRFRKKEKKP